MNIRIALSKWFFLAGLACCLAVDIGAQSYPPACVITMPYNNAYYKKGSEMVIIVYATDIGKSYQNGVVQSVTCYKNGIPVGQALPQANHTYRLALKDLPEGIFTLTAKARNDKGVEHTSVGVQVKVGVSAIPACGLSAGKGKYLANIFQRREALGYSAYWNGVTSENACKWGSIEANRGEYRWEGADLAYTYATTRHMVFRYHAGVWASQYPKWLLTLTKEEARAAVIQYLKAIAERYPLADQIDLLNEQLFRHQKDNQQFRELLGGTGTQETDYEWQIWLFQQGRTIFPNTKLVLNDYGLEGDFKAIKAQLELCKVLRDRGLLDGFGTQAHAFNVDKPGADTLRASLDAMALSGVPIFVTELDMNGGIKGKLPNDSLQYLSYKKSFPVFWEHPAVAGITLWGYLKGSTWMTGTGLVTPEGVENEAMLWLKNYMRAQPDVGYPLR